MVGYKAQQLDPISTANIPLSMQHFKSGMVLMSSPVKDVLDAELEETTMATDILDCKTVWDRFQKEHSTPEMRRIKKADFVQMFKLYVNTGSNSDSYRLDTSTHRHTALGWKMKSQPWNLC